MNDDDTETDDTEAEDTKVEPETESEDGQDLDTALEAEEEIAAFDHAKFGRKFVVVGFALSTLMGGLLGLVGGKVFSGPDKTIALRSEIQQSLDTLQQATKAQTINLGTTNNVQQQAKTRLDNLQSEGRVLDAQIKTLQQNIELLQNITETNLKISTDRIAILEALSGENTDIFSGPSSITSRLDELEKKIAAADISSEQDIADVTSSNLAQEQPAKETLGVKRISVKPPIDPTHQTALDHLIDTFPRVKMLAVVKAQEKTATKKIGWLKRALSRHVRVGNDNAPDPYITIQSAEEALRDGEITSAVQQISQLNPPVRASAAEWLKAAKKAAPNLE